MKKELIIAAIIALCGSTALYFYPPKQLAQNTILPSSAVVTLDPKNATYMVEGKEILLVDGRAEEVSSLDSVSKRVTTIFGEPTIGDLTGDGRRDAAVVLVQNSGGSGTFYYVAAAVSTGSGTKGTNAVLLGDRIAPQTIEIKNGQIIANYAERKPSEPMTAKPSVGVTKYLKLNGTTLEVSRPVVGVGEHCGGNIANAPTCREGYVCTPTPGSHLPFGDVGGTCVPDVVN